MPIENSEEPGSPRTVLAVMLALAVGCFAASAQDFAFLTNGLAAYYPFDTGAEDESGRGHHGILSPEVTLVEGMVGSALRFPGGSSHVRIPAAPGINFTQTEGFTAALWVKADSVSSWMPLIEWRDGGSIGTHVWLTVNCCGVNQAVPGSLYVWLNGPEHHIFSSIRQVIVPGQWHQVAITCDYASAAAKLYCDGDQVAQVTIREGVPLTAYDFWLGYRPGYTGYAGLIDEVRLYDHALSGSELSRLHDYDLNVNFTNTPPFISIQPLGKDHYVGDAVELRVVARGSVPLTYQWHKDGVSLLGATNSVLVLTNATEVASGDYTVVVSNDYGSVTSAAARVDVTLRTFPYVADFESTAGPEWSNRKTEVTPVGNRRFLGQFGNDKVSLNLNGLPPHTTVTVSFDLFVLQTWDGNHADVGPDMWECAVNGGPTLLHTTFMNFDNGSTQAYPDNYPQGRFPRHTGATEIDTLGYRNVNKAYGDSVYRLFFTIPHSYPSVSFDFLAMGLQELYDESWGLDNVTVVMGRSDAIFVQAASWTVTESQPQLHVDVQRATLAPLATTVTIDYATTDDTAMAGQDYAAVMGTLTFGPGETNKTISIPILDDALVESEEEFRLTLSNPSEGVFLATSNVVIQIEANDFPTEWTDTFENLDGWIPFGDPPPCWVSSFQGRSGVFDNNGDPNYASGAVSKQRFDLSTGYVIESEVYVALTTREGYWACAVSGVADPKLPDWGGDNPSLLFGLWATWNEDNGTLHGALCASYETEGGTETFWDPWNTPDGQTVGDRLLSRWCTLTIIVSPDGFPAFLADGVLFYEGTKPVSSRLRSATGQLYLGSRSSDWPGKAYHDSISFYQLERSTAVALNLDNAWVDPDTNAVHQVALGNDRVYLATDFPMVRVLDLDGSGKPVLKGSWEPFLDVSDLAVSGSTLFVAGWELDFLSTIDRVDFANPAQPVSRGFCDTPGYVTGLALDGTHLFVAEDEEGLEILDLSREPFPAVVGQYPTTGSAVAVEVVNGKAFLVTSKSLLILDVSNPAQPVRLGALYLGGEVTTLEVAGETAYILNRQSGLHLIDVSNPALPMERSVYRRATAARAIAVSGPYVFLAAGWQGLQVLEVPEMGEPKWLTSYGTSSPAEDVAVVGNRVWVAAGAQGLLGFELLDGRLNVEWPASPAQPLALSWQAEAGWQLERAESLASPDWTLVPGSATTNRVSLPLDLPQAFFRLRKP